MSQTKAEIKQEFAKRHYKRWYADLKFDEFDYVEQARGNMTRKDFLMMLIKEHKQSAHAKE